MNNPARSAVALSLMSTKGYKVTRITHYYEEIYGRAPTKQEINASLKYFAKPNGELDFVASLLSSTAYFSNSGKGNNNNNTWIESTWQDVFGRTSVGDSLAGDYLAQLAALPANTTVAKKLAKRLDLMKQLVVTGVGAGALQQSIDDHHKEFLTDVFADFLNQSLARNYPRTAGAPTSTVDLSEITPLVTALVQPGGSLIQLYANIVSTTEAYQKSGYDRALPAGAKATAVVYGNFTGVTDPALGKPVLDLAIATSDNKVLIFKGQVGGGYPATPTLTLTLPTNAAPTDLVAMDVNGDGLDDLLVANGGLTAATTNSVSLFLNNSPVGGPISFAARTDLNGGNNPVALVTGDIDGDNKVDIAVADGQVNGSGNYVVDVLLGDGAGNFAHPTAFKVGDNIPSAAELTSPTDVALGNVTGSTRPDLVVTGANGMVVLTNTTAAVGAPAFTPLAARVTNAAMTSVAIGALNTDTNLDIAATTDLGGGQVRVFRNDGGGVFVAPTLAAGTIIDVGATPRAVTIIDHNADGRPDIFVTHGGTPSGVSVIFNETVDIVGSPDPLSFAVPISYPTTGDQPTSLAIGDANQDGTLDLAIGYAGNEFISLMQGQQQGVLQVPTDKVWLDWLYKSLTGVGFKATELSKQLASLTSKELAYLTGPDGSASPLLITPTDSSNFTYELLFGPQLLDGTYTLVIGPNTLGVNLKDFGDTDGSFANTGNPMNQNQNAVNGEVFADRFNGILAVNHTDDGRFVAGLFHDFLGATETNGRDPDNATYATLVEAVDKARLASFASIATTIVNSQEEIDRLITGLYQRYLHRLPTSGSPTAELESNRSKIIKKKLTYRTLVFNLLSSPEYFTSSGGNNSGWITHVYDDLMIPQDALFTKRLNQLNAGVISRTAVARLTVFGTAALQQTATEYFIEFLGRTPVRNADKKLDETTALIPLLKRGHDEQVIAQLIASAEYLRLNGNSNVEWLKSIYLKVLGRASIDTSPTGTEFNGMLDTLLAGPNNGYENARFNAVTGPLMLGSQEYRDRIFTDYYINLLHRAGLSLPTAAELATQQAWYAAHGGRLESVAANLLSSAEYLALNGSGAQNQTWLTKVYNDLLDRGINDGTTADQQAAQAQLAYLNSHSSNQASVQAARYTIALQVLSSAEYRRFLVAGFLNTYLAENKPTRPAPGDSEIDSWVSLMAGGTTQQGIIGLMLKTRQFFLLQ